LDLSSDLSSKLSSAGTGSKLAAAPHATVATRTLAEASPAALATDDVHGASASLKVDAARTVPQNPPAAEASPGGPWPYRPRLKLGYRRFSLGALGAPASASASASSSAAASAVAGAAESFESLSLDLYPISGYLRAGTSTQFGWQSGQFDRSGDYFLAQSLMSGIQFPGRITPFAEVLAGAGYMRRAQTGAASLPGAYFQVGLEGGIELYVAGRAYTSIAIGYLHTGNFLVVQQSLTSVKQDSWALKVGIGI
jgi:hypothetical protein